MFATIELVEFRHQDILAAAARYRLASQAGPALRPLCKEVVWSAVLSVCASARGALDARSLHTLRLGK
jgi:hypothetical protein